MRRIAAAAGCSTMGLYSRFGGKDGVVDELYAEGFERLIDSMRANPPTDDPLADLRRGAGATATRPLANATHYMVMFGGEVPGFVPSDSSHVAHARSTASSPRCALHRRRLFDGSADQIAEMLWGAIHGLVMLEIVGINPLMSDPLPRFDARTRRDVPRGLAHG